MRLEPTIQKKTKFKLFGFDTETADNNQSLVLACITDRGTFYNKRSVIEEFKNSVYDNAVICCTNLNFDFYAIFQGMEEEKFFNRLDRGSRLLQLRTYRKGNNFSFTPKTNYKKLVFMDTGNYAPFSVDVWGKILDMPKIECSFKGRFPTTNEEWAELKYYCERDASISKKAIEFLYNSFYELGATPKLTIGSTSMSLFRNKYLNDTYYLQSNEVLLDTFKSYYGANCHAYARGTFNNVHHYDINALYPTVMQNEYPNPNKPRYTRQNTDEYIWNYHGASDVSISVPLNDQYPLLPYKSEYTLFPVGTFRGWYTHVELRESIKRGYTITKVHKTVYYKDSCEPFKDMMLDLWNKRRLYQIDDNPMQLVTKLLMNSLYGKTGQKFEGVEEWKPVNEATLKFLSSLEFIERVGNFIRIKKNIKPACFCIPIWAAYTTAYGRIKLHEYIDRCQPLYVDTDCVFTFKTMKTNPDKLGALKHENKGIAFNECIFVRSKFYLKDLKARIKGISKMNKEKFMLALEGKPVPMQKWIKFKEGKRRGLNINEIHSMSKMLDLEDKKRKWVKPFDYKEQQFSRPLIMIEGISEQELNKVKVEEFIKCQV